MLDEDEVIKDLTDWENPPTISDLKQNLDDAKIEHDVKTGKIDTWLDHMHMTGSAAVNTPKGSSKVAPRLIRKQAEWRYASLSEPFLSTPDIFNVYPVTAGDRERAIQNELVLNNQFNTKINKVQFIDAYVRDATDQGTVIVKVGWDTEEEIVTKTVPIYEFIPEPTGQLAQKYTALIQLQAEQPETYANYSTLGLDQALQMFMAEGVAYFAKQVGEEEVEETVETKNQPTVEVCDPHNIILDPSCNGDASRANFVGETFKASKSDLTKDGKYHNLDKINVEAASPLASPDYEDNQDNSTFNFNDDARKQFVVFTYWGTWDIRKDGVAVPIVASWVGETLIRLEENPFPDRKPPFVTAQYMPVRRSLFGEPDGELLMENQAIVGAVTRGMIDLMGKSANAQTGIRKDLLDVTNLRKYRRGEDYQFNTIADPRQGIFQHTYPEIPQSAYSMLTLQTNDAESLTGVKAFSSGISGKSLGPTATSARGALDAASKRELGILRRLAAGIIEIGRKIISMNAEFLSEEETIRITAKEFVQVRRDDLAGNFDLRLTISTAEEDNQKAEELAFMLQTMGNNMDPSLSKMILADIARLRKMPAMALKIEEYEPQPDPFQQEEQQLKLELLKRQIAKEEALTAKHISDAGLSDSRAGKEQTQGHLNMAKGGTEQAKARQLSSDADSKDLDFVEQQSGVHQERDLQKARAAAQANMATELVKGEMAAAQTNPPGSRA